MDLKVLITLKMNLEEYIDYYNNKRIKRKLESMSLVRYQTHTQQAS